MDIISYNTRKANKDHKCNWCGKKIEKGKKYQTATVKADDIYVWKSHLYCDKLYEELNMRNDDMGDGIDSDTFMETIYEFLSEKLESEEYERVLDNDQEVEKACELLNIEMD